MNSDSYVKFCPVCASPIVRKPAHGRIRPVCEACGHIHFEEPKVAAAALILQDEKVLLVRRTMEPMQGRWTLPAGFIDADEDPALAAAREVEEETGLIVMIEDLLDVIYGKEHPNGASIVILYKAHIVSGDLKAGDDVDAAAFFDQDNLPALAFQATKRALGHLK
jgi:ADP-ribose pyrophosphatase YjhB (NUDIX family)